MDRKMEPKRERKRRPQRYSHQQHQRRKSVNNQQGRILKTAESFHVGLCSLRRRTETSKANSNSDSNSKVQGKFRVSKLSRSLVCAVPACRALVLTGQRSPSRQTVLGVVGSSTPELYDPTRYGKLGTTRPRDPSLAELLLRSLLR